MAWRDCPWCIAFPCMGFYYRLGRGPCPGGIPGTGAVPGRQWAAPGVSPLAEVRGVCSTWRSLLSPRLHQPVVLMARGGRAQPPGRLGTEVSIIYVLYGMLPSHISRRRVGCLGPVVTRFLRTADEAQKSSIYTRPLLVATRRSVGRCV